MASWTRTAATRTSHRFPEVVVGDDCWTVVLMLVSSVRASGSAGRDRVPGATSCPTRLEALALRRDRVLRVLRRGDTRFEDAEPCAGRSGEQCQPAQRPAEPPAPQDGGSDRAARGQRLAGAQ